MNIHNYSTVIAISIYRAICRVDNTIEAGLSHSERRISSVAHQRSELKSKFSNATKFRHGGRFLGVCINCRHLMSLEYKISHHHSLYSIYTDVSLK